MIIYFVTKADEIVYIGQTKQSLQIRKNNHISLSLRGGNSVLGAAIRKHGPEAFKWEKHSVYYNQVDLDAAEKHYIAKYTPRYNVAPGGQNGIEWSWNKGRKENRPEVLKHISESAHNRRPHKRGPATPEAIKARSDARTAKLRLRTRPFICHQNNKVYVLVIDAAKDLGIKANGIYAALNPNHKMQTYMGYSFSYLEIFRAG